MLASKFDIINQRQTCWFSWLNHHVCKHVCCWVESPIMYGHGYKRYNWWFDGIIHSINGVLLVLNNWWRAITVFPKKIINRFHKWWMFHWENANDNCYWPGPSLQIFPATACRGMLQDPLRHAAGGCWSSAWPRRLPSLFLCLGELPSDTPYISYRCMAQNTTFKYLWHQMQECILQLIPFITSCKYYDIPISTWRLKYKCRFPFRLKFLPSPGKKAVLWKIIAVAQGKRRQSDWQ